MAKVIAICGKICSVKTTVSKMMNMRCVLVQLLLQDK